MEQTGGFEPPTYCLPSNQKSNLLEESLIIFLVEMGGVAPPYLKPILKPFSTHLLLRVLSHCREKPCRIMGHRTLNPSASPRGFHYKSGLKSSANSPDLTFVVLTCYSQTKSNLRIEVGWLGSQGITIIVCSYFVIVDYSLYRKLPHKS